MVNYCCVYGCGRNSKAQNLRFYSLPNEKHRQIAWLKAAGREDIIEKLTISGSDCLKRNSKRICSRHFLPDDFRKDRTRQLEPHAVPTLHLPGSFDKEISDDEHNDIACNHCMKPILGFRYKCIICEDFDLCHHCNQLEVHREHFMLRIPKPMKFKLVDNFIKKCRKLFNEEHLTPGFFADDLIALSDDDSSDDDQPITKYARNYDSGVDLSEDVKDLIRKEIQRVNSLKLDQQKKSRNPLKIQRKQDASETNTERERIIIPKKRMKIEHSVESSFTNSAPDVLFADVNDVKYHQMDLKPESMDYPNMMPVISTVSGTAAKPNLSRTPTETYSYPSTVEVETPVQVPVPAAQDISPGVSGVQTYPQVPAKEPAAVPTYPEAPAEGTSSGDVQPVMHVKLSDDLTELMIEVAGSNQRTFYKCD
ncbi:THAP domain-containing protein [Phthorimaea operculella]|nr:THAP domain-containing protein [Phthorimaea operculella]